LFLCLLVSIPYRDDKNMHIWFFKKQMVRSFNPL